MTPAATSRSAASWAARAGRGDRRRSTRSLARTIAARSSMRRTRTPPMHRADLGGVDVDDAGDREAALAEAAVAGEGLAEVAGADDHDGPVVGQAELAADLVDEVLDLVADAAGAVAAEVAEVLADLGGVDAGEVGELLGRHVRRCPTSDCSRRIRRYTGSRATVASGIRRPRLVVAIGVTRYEPRARVHKVPCQRRQRSPCGSVATVRSVEQLARGASLPRAPLRGAARRRRGSCVGHL